MPKYNFISGLPRSGSTLLASILSQNPEVATSIMSPVAYIFNAVQQAMSRENEAASVITDAHRRALLRGVLDAFYPDAVQVFDNNRRWCNRLSALATLLPDAKVICCVRDPVAIVNSVERVVRENPLESSRIFGFQPNMTVYDRFNVLMQPLNLFGYAWAATKDAYFGPHANRLIMLDYELLAVNPLAAMALIHKCLKIDLYPYDFKHLKSFPEAEQIDVELGLPGLHRVKSAVEWSTPRIILPPDLVERIPKPFW